MTFVYSILFIFLFVLLLGVLIVAKVLRTIFGIGRRMTGKEPDPSDQPKENTSNYNYQQNTSERPSHHGGHKKVFDDNEGEYIDFEEIKD